MPLRNYGVWKGTPTRFRAERRDIDPERPHGYLKFVDGVSTRSLEAAINVKSISDDSRLVYWHVEDLEHPLTDLLKELDFGWNGLGNHNSGPPGDVALDYLRSGIVNVREGRLIEHDVPGQQNDIIDFLEPFFERAIHQDATVYLYGEPYRDNRGVHDVHMNQGNDAEFEYQNGVFQDGGVLVEFADGHWEAFLIAFASQASATNNQGNANGPLFGNLLGTRPRPRPGPGPGRGRGRNGRRRGGRPARL